MNNAVNGVNQKTTQQNIPPRNSQEQVVRPNPIPVRVIRDIINLTQVGEKVSTKVVISKCELREQKNNPNKKFMVVDIQDSTGVLIGNKIWAEKLAQMPAEMKDTLLSASGENPVCVGIGGIIERYLDMPYMNIQGLVFRTGDNPNNYVPSTKEDSEGMFEYIINTAKSIREPFSTILVDKLENNKDLFESVPAAKRYHDNFKGGLLEHTYKMLKSYLSVANLYDKINKEIMIFLIIVHDFEKINGYTLMPSIEWTMQEELVGHQVMGAIKVYNDLKAHGVEDETIMPILNAIISHHGKAEWGAAKPAITPEARLLHHIDFMISDIAKTNQTIEESSKEEGMIGKNIYFSQYK